MEKSKKKILYVITKSNMGGAQRYVYELATNLSKNSFDVAVAFGGNGLLKEKLESAGIRTHVIASFERDINLAKEVRSMFELAQIIRMEKPDIVHLNSSKAGGSGALIARLLGVKRIIFTAHGWPFFESRNILWRSVVWFLSYLTALFAHTVILVSHHDKVRTYMPFIKKKRVVIYPAVPHIDFKSRDESRTTLFTKEQRAVHEHDLWLVTTSEFTQNKNLLAAIQAVEVYNKTHARKLFLTLIGDGELRAELERYLQNHGLTQSVLLTGFVDNARAYLKAFDIFLLPSRKEGLPYGLLEAGSAELACIASNIGGIPEVIEHGKNALLIDPNRQETLVSALDIYTNDPSRAHAHAVLLKKNIDHAFHLDTMLKRTVEVYDL